MKMKIGLYLAGALFMAMIARASVIVYNAQLVNETALAYNNTYTLDIQSNGINALSAQAVYSSATVANVTFGDGRRSTGSFTVADYTALSSASAVNHITVASNTGLENATIIVPGFTFRNSVDWAPGNTSSNTAVNIKNALSQVPYLSVSAAGNVVYATATYGSYYNSFGMVSTNAGLQVFTPTFVGGRDNAIARINGVNLQQGREWTAATSNAATATSLASAINAASLLNTKLTAAAVGAVVTSTSTKNGALFNYLITSSTPTALTPSGVAMVNGITPAFTLGSTLFSATNGLSLALPVQYTGSPAIGGLTTATTYYAIPVNSSSFKLAKYSTSAVAGIDLVVITSTNSSVSQNTYTLTPLGITGIPSFKWQVSNDNSNWSDLFVSSVTMGSTGTPYAIPPTSSFWTFGYIGTRYLRLNAVAPTTGGISLVVTMVGTN